MRDGELLALVAVAGLARVEAEQREDGVEQVADVVALAVDERAVLGGLADDCTALDAATGELRWRTNILTDAGAANLTWAMAASPLVVDGLVVVLPGGGNGRSVAAYDATTGDIAWTALSDVQGYAAPMLVVTVNSADGITHTLGYFALAATTSGSESRMW